jgi:hypothetical protein
MYKNADQVTRKFISDAMTATLQAIQAECKKSKDALASGFHYPVAEPELEV